jgi:hypothetical protein
MEGRRPEGHITGPRNKRMKVDGQKIEKNGGVFWGSPGPRRGCWAIEGMEFVLYEDQVMDLLIRNM